MKIKTKTQMSESMVLAVFLTLAGGFQDAYSYNIRGKVFANAQTGNIVLLGQSLAEGNWTRALTYVTPVLAFVAGVYVTEWMKHLFQHSKTIHWRQLVLVMESIMLFAVGFIPQSENMMANMLMSFACAMQVNSFRKFRGIPCATTMCIGNMRAATEMMCKYHITKDPALKKKSFHYYEIILIFAIGAILGVVFSQSVGDKAIWISMGMLIIGFILMFVKEDIEGQQE